MRKIEFSLGENYHIYNRGTEKRVIFVEKADFERFMMLLYLANDTASILLHKKKKWRYLNPYEKNRDQTLVHIGAYCLMPNHFHILVKEKRINGISLFMHKLTTAYTMYFNVKYKRTGSLFENVFKAKHVQCDRYLKYLFSYIHLNPIKIVDPSWKEFGLNDLKMTQEFISLYPYSSYFEYLQKTRDEGVIINKDQFPDYFSTPQDFLNIIDDFLNFRDEA